MIKWDVAVDDVARLEPQFRMDVAALLGGSVYDWRVVYAYRSLELQASLYEKYRNGGPRAAPPGESAHNFGLAVDVQLWVPVGQNVNALGVPQPSLGPKVMEWNVKAPGWQWLFAAVWAAPFLHSGISYGDYDHIERVDWKQFKDWSTRGGMPV
jgi:hypothetical protein